MLQQIRAAVAGGQFSTFEVPAEGLHDEDGRHYPRGLILLCRQWIVDYQVPPTLEGLLTAARNYQTHGWLAFAMVDSVNPPQKTPGPHCGDG
jgi:hypothetical protein